MTTPISREQAIEAIEAEWQRDPDANNIWPADKYDGYFKGLKAAATIILTYDDAETLELILSMPDDPDYVGLPHHLALMVKEQQAQVQEALGIIDAMAEYSEDATNLLAEKFSERIAVLRLKS